LSRSVYSSVFRESEKLLHSRRKLTYFTSPYHYSQLVSTRLPSQHRRRSCEGPLGPDSGSCEDPLGPDSGNNYGCEDPQFVGHLQ